MRVLIELRHSAKLHAAATGVEAFAKMAPAVESLVPGLVLDHAFSSVQIPGLRALQPGASPYALDQPVAFSLEPQESTYVVRGQIPDDPVAQKNTLSVAYRNPGVVGVFADPVIESCPICPGDPPLGTDANVANLLSAAALSRQGFNGTGILVAVVDTGINIRYLVSRGRRPKLDAGRSWTPAGVSTKPGQHPKDHGTMCAYDVGIAAPKATLLDYAVLLSRTPGQTAMSGLLSDAVVAYSKLLTIINTMPARSRAMVVTNSWGMFSPTWDFPVGHPGNYSDNPAHPFNIIVASLETAGADIFFAAGNCGRDCPDGRCQFGSTPPICGANSHPKVICVAGIDVQKRRVGYSSQGPGRLNARKPDLAAYTHFKGSLVYPEDGGTSAACPVAAGVVAAIRTRCPASQVSPFQIRSLLRKTAQDLGGTGFDYDYGWGAINPAALLGALRKRTSARPKRMRKRPDK